MSYQLAWIIACAAVMLYGVACIRYGVAYWPDRARWAVHGALLCLGGWCALLLGVVILSCV